VEEVVRLVVEVVILVVVEVVIVGLDLELMLFYTMGKDILLYRYTKLEYTRCEIYVE
jgi:hypothetical protein